MSTATCLDRVAVTIAHHLAWGHGHTWGGHPLPAELTPEAIEAAVMAGGEEGPVGWGITRPFVDESGAIVHTTGSGRLTWIVMAETLQLIFSRPAGPFCMISVSWYDGPAEISILTYPDMPRIYARHVEDVIGCLPAVLAALQAAGLDISVDPEHPDQMTADVVAALDPFRVDELADKLADLRAAEWEVERIRRQVEEAAGFEEAYPGRAGGPIIPPPVW